VHVLYGGLPLLDDDGPFWEMGDEATLRKKFHGRRVKLPKRQRLEKELKDPSRNRGIGVSV
jgi:hypothetical protein